MWVTPPTPNTESHCSTLAFVHGLCGSKHLYPSGLNRTSCVIKLFPDGFHSHPSDCFFFKFTQSLLVQLSKAWHSNQNRAHIELQITLRNKRQKAALSSFATGSMSSPELLWAQVQLPQDSCSCSHEAAMAGGSVAATWLFKQPTIPQASQGLQRNLAPERLWQYQEGLYAFQICKSSCLTKRQSTTPFQKGFLTILAFTQLNLLLYKQQAFRKELVLPRKKRERHAFLPFLTF